MPPTTRTTEPGPAEDRPAEAGNSPLDTPDAPSAVAPRLDAPAEAAAPAPAPPYDASAAPTQTMGATPATDSTPPAIGLAATGDRCANCGAPLASDQQYCLRCGERRGQARFHSTAPTTGTAASSAAGAAPPARGSRFSAGTTLIAGVATLLLAMGIGVLIGHETASSTPAQTSAKAPVVYLNGGGSAAAASTAAPATTAPTGNAGSSGSSNKSSKSHKNANSSASSSTAAAATTPTTVKKLPPATVTVGAKGSGPGYQHGKFTGNFFGN